MFGVRDTSLALALASRRDARATGVPVRAKRVRRSGIVRETKRHFISIGCSRPQVLKFRTGASFQRLGSRHRAGRDAVAPSATMTRPARR